MIEESDYKFPRKKEQKREQNDEERRKAIEVLAYLEKLPWRPLGDVW